MLHVVERQIVSQNSGLFRDNPNEAHNLKVVGSNPTPATTFKFLEVPLRQLPAARR